MKIVVLVDKENRQVGTMPVETAHEGTGTLHRAVSALVYRAGKSGVEVLLQKRSARKKLWPLFWTNTVCTHPQTGEENSGSLTRRLKEEMGITAQAKDFRFVFFLYYQAPYNSGFSEHELDGVYLLKWDGNPVPNLLEVADYRWTPLAAVIRDMETNPDTYTPWFHLMMRRDAFRDALLDGDSV